MWHVIFTQCWQPHTHFLYHSHDCGRDLCAAEGICKYFVYRLIRYLRSVSVEAMLVMSQWVEVTAITTTERRRRAAISTSSFNAARTLNLPRTWMSWKTVSFSPPGAGTRTSWTEHCDLCSFCAELFFTVTSNVTCSSSQTEYHTWIKTL